MYNIVLIVCNNVCNVCNVCNVWYKLIKCNAI